MNTRLAIFDCDGTLSDGQAAVCEAMEAACAEVGLTAPPRADVRRIVGLSLPQAMRELYPQLAPEQHGELVEAYKQAFRTARMAGQVHEPIFDGVVELLQRLHADGWALAVATGKSDRGLASTLTANGLTDLFGSTHTADRYPSKPHPAMILAAMDHALAEPANTVMIGDTVFDMQMAEAAQVRAIGVAWGYHEPEELRTAGAVAVAEDAAELEALIRG